MGNEGPSKGTYHFRVYTGPVVVGRVGNQLSEVSLVGHRRVTVVGTMHVHLAIEAESREQAETLMTVWWAEARLWVPSYRDIELLRVEQEV